MSIDSRSEVALARPLSILESLASIMESELLPELGKSVLTLSFLLPSIGKSVIVNSSSYLRSSILSSLKSPDFLPYNELFDKFRCRLLTAA